MKRQLPSKASIERELIELETRILRGAKSTQEQLVASILKPPSVAGGASTTTRVFPQREEELVFCHGNLNPANIIYDATTSSIQFIELQYAGPNYQVCASMPAVDSNCSSVYYAQ